MNGFDTNSYELHRPARVYIRSSAYISPRLPLFKVLMGFLSRLILGTSLGLFSFCLFVLSNSDVIVFVYLFYFVIFLLKACSFLTGDRKGVSADRTGGGEELGGVEGVKTANRIHYVKKEFIFNKRKNE